MLAKGETSADAQKLVACLIKSHRNKRVELVEIRGFVAAGALSTVRKKANAPRHFICRTVPHRVI